MLRITRQYSTAAVKKYYEHSDYYQEGPNALKGYWFGVGAKRLGLVGEVHKQQFDRVV
ncbi:MAG: relaxase domain-containing protein, partial [Planctomycetales bacterium]|nr:relaxase domain-containing protein [Planctomycetales bacterium]